MAFLLLKLARNPFRETQSLQGNTSKFLNYYDRSLCKERGTKALVHRRKERVKITAREGCALDMSSVGDTLSFKNTHEIPSEVTGKCPSASAQGKIRPIIFSFPEKPSVL